MFHQSKVEQYCHLWVENTCTPLMSCRCCLPLSRECVCECVHACVWVFSEWKNVFTDAAWLSSQHLPRFWKAKTLMTLIHRTLTCTHTHTHTHALNTNMDSQSLFPSVCSSALCNVERVVHSYMDLGNLISHWARTACITSDWMEWGKQSQKWRQLEESGVFDFEDGFRSEMELRKC